MLLTLSGCFATPFEPPERTPPPQQGCAETEQLSGPAPGRRLTVWEYRNTVQDILEVDLSDLALPEDPRADGFSNTADALVVTFEHVQAFDALAQTAVERVAMDALVQRFGACDLQAPECLTLVWESIAAALFSRPLNDEDRNALALALQGDSAPEEQLRLIVRAMLQSPAFLYKLEPAGPVSDTIASRLSFLVLGSRAQPSTGAEIGALDTPEGRGALVSSWMEDPRARRASRRYLIDWLNLDALDVMVRDPDLYPDFSPELASQMKQETLDLFDDIVWSERGPLMRLFQEQRTKVPRGLALLYGLQPQGDAPRWYDLSEMPQRRGVLTHAGVLALSGAGDEASLVKRGLYILETILCDEIDAPPAGLDTSPPIIAPGQTQRSASQDRLQSPACEGCHTQIDPLSYGLDPYDGIGAFRTEDEFGNALSPEGVFNLEGQQTPYASADAYMELLAQSATVERCLVQKQLQFALGRPLHAEDDCAIDRVLSRFRASGGTYQALILAIAEDPSFASPSSGGPR